MRKGDLFSFVSHKGAVVLFGFAGEVHSPNDTVQLVFKFAGSNSDKMRDVNLRCNPQKRVSRRVRTPSIVIERTDYRAVDAV